MLIYSMFSQVNLIKLMVFCVVICFCAYESE